MSDPSGNVSRACRNHSLIQRFRRLRITEFPTRLLTVTPNFLCFSSDLAMETPLLDAIAMTKLPEVRRLPNLMARLKSRLHKIRSACRKRPVFESTGLFRRNASCEALSAFATTSLENCPACTSLGSCSKSMDSFSSDTARLIGTFHRRPSIFVVSRVAES